MKKTGFVVWQTTKPVRIIWPYFSLTASFCFSALILQELPP
jgi:hypothetical protein